MAELTRARLTIAFAPFKWWHRKLGGGGKVAEIDLVEAKRLAAHVEWGARRLPFPTKCLPRAMALSWMLRRRNLSHTVVFAVRPASRRGFDDDLHAWVEVEGNKIIGDLPGEWVETLRLGD
jgi:hypothetical protein